MGDHRPTARSSACPLFPARVRQTGNASNTCRLNGYPPVDPGGLHSTPNHNIEIIMTALFKPTRPFPRPAEAEIVTHKGRPHVRIGGALYPLSRDGAKFLKPAASYYADIPQADGRRKRTKLSPNKAAAQMMLTEQLKRIENAKAGSWIGSPSTASARWPTT
jgi:hypothetical protein